MKLFVYLFILLCFASFAFAEIDTMYDTISASTNDGYMDLNADFSVSSSTIIIGSAETTPPAKNIGVFRFENLPINQEQYIVYAKLYWYQAASEVGDIDNCDISIKIEDTANSAAFSDSADYFARTWSVDSIIWESAHTTINTYVALPAVTALLQSVVDRADWDSAHSVSFRLAPGKASFGSDYLTVHSYDGDPAKAVYLTYATVNYSGDCEVYTCLCDSTSVRDSYIPDEYTEYDTMRLIVYSYCTPDSSCYLSDSAINAEIDTLNVVLDRAKIHVVHDIVHIYSDYFTNHQYVLADHPLDKGLYLVHPDSAAQVHIVDGYDVSFGTYPWNAAPDPFASVNGAWLIGGLSRSIAHELIHTFGLMHTDVGSTPTIKSPPINDAANCGPCWEYPIDDGQSDSLRNRVGDLCSDTDPSSAVSVSICSPNSYDEDNSDSLIMRSVYMGTSITSQQAGRIRCHTRYWFPGWYIFMGDPQ